MLLKVKILLMIYTCNGDIIYLTWTIGQLDIFRPPEGNIVHKTFGDQPALCR